MTNDKFFRQVFLQNTANIFQPGPRQVPNILPVKDTELAQPVLDTVKPTLPEDLDDFDKEPPTPTNCQPPSEVVAIERPEPVPVTPSDSGTVEENLDRKVEENGQSKDADADDDDESTASKEESNVNTSDFESDPETDSSEAPVEACNQYVQLPNVVIEEDSIILSPDDIAHQESSTDEPVEQQVEEPSHPQPKLAMQEDFNLSPTSEKADTPIQSAPTLARTRSRESVDSAKFAMTETEFSDWADNSLGGDLDAELELDPEPVVKQAAVKDVVQTLSPPETPVKSNGSTNFDDIEFADDSEGRTLDLKGYKKLVEDVPTPEKPVASPVNLNRMLSLVYLF